MEKWVLIRKAIAASGRCALVTVEATEGSVPRDAGAWMIITAQGYHGTIGGGALEWKAMAEAQALLKGDAQSRDTRHVLGPDLGQCCGGVVRLRTQIFDATSVVPEGEEIAGRNVLLFGAGHVGRALVLAAANLPIRINWCDDRPGAFPSPVPGRVVCHSRDMMELIAGCAAGSLAYVMTHSHALDLEIVDCALRNPNVARVGLIGSSTKRARFVSRLRSAGITEVQLERLICPIGIAGLRGKEAGVIAASTVAQILLLDQELRQGSQLERHAQLSA